MRHTTECAVDIACCHSHLHLGCVLMCQNLVGAKVICSRRMMGANDWAGTATARTRDRASSQEVHLQSSKREKRQLQSSRETTGTGNSFRARDSSAIPFWKTVHEFRQQLWARMFESI